jgi:hypothetical protein
MVIQTRRIRVPLYICRWPNGDFSAVSAKDPTEAAYLLSEVGPVGDAKLFDLANFMVHFSLPRKMSAENWDKMLPPLHLDGFGAQTLCFLWDHIYPEFEKATNAVLAGEAAGSIGDDEAMTQLDQALARERVRLMPAIARTASGERICMIHLCTKFPEREAGEAGGYLVH